MKCSWKEKWKQCRVCMNSADYRMLINKVQVMNNVASELLLKIFKLTNKNFAIKIPNGNDENNNNSIVFQ